MSACSRLASDSKRTRPVCEVPCSCRLKENYILLSTDGPGRNILKFKPPMCFSVDNAQHVVAKLDDILTDMEEKVRSCETLRIKHPPGKPDLAPPPPADPQHFNLYLLD